MFPILSTVLKFIPARTLILGTALTATIVGGGFAVKHWHETAIANRDKAHQVELQQKSQESVNQINVLQGRIEQLGVDVADKRAKLDTANARLAAVLNIPLVPYPPIPDNDPCTEVRKVAAQREATLNDHIDLAIDAKEAAEAVIPPLTLQLNLSRKQTTEALSVADRQRELASSLAFKLEKSEDSTFKWKVGAVTVSAVGLVYILVKH